MKYICALIVVDDVHRSRFLYESLLGQTVANDYGENIEFEGGFAIHQESHFSKMLHGRPIISQSNSCELYFEDVGLEKLAETLRHEGFELLHDVEEQPWHQRVFRFYDYDKNLIEVGEPMEHTAWRLHTEGMFPEEIAQLTQISIQRVMNGIETYSEY